MQLPLKRTNIGYHASFSPCMWLVFVGSTSGRWYCQDLSGRYSYRLLIPTDKSAGGAEHVRARPSAVEKGASADLFYSGGHWASLHQ